MRTLVEQTVREIQDWLVKMELDGEVDLHTLMGGEDSGDWHNYPERHAILVGTQDMILSRALNRGYGSGRARWPAEFGLLHTDCLWVLDEVQLMDVGLTTATQLHAFRERLGAASSTWWMSATLQPAWLRTAESASLVDKLEEGVLKPSPTDKAGTLWEITKPCSLKKVEDSTSSKFADLVLKAHQASDPKSNYQVTLVVVNTVNTAIDLHKSLAKSIDQNTTDLRLVHSRFRGQERSEWATEFLSREACTADGANRIIVSTQIVEAGVDISSTVLVTELAPWASLVQRFGRAARYGGSCNVIVVDGLAEDDEKAALPYSLEELAAARKALAEVDDVSLSGLATFEETALTDESRTKELYPYSPSITLGYEAVLDLFDTTPDLGGMDIDVSPLIRSGEERDVVIYWRDLDEAPDGVPNPNASEICRLPFLVARKWLKGIDQCWIWHYATAEWRRPSQSEIYPGRTIVVAKSSGGYDAQLGWTGRSSTIPPEVEQGEEATENADRSPLSDARSKGDYQTIRFHSAQVVSELGQIVAQLPPFPDEKKSLLELAAALHDWGKAHPRFQGKIARSNGSPTKGRSDLAKAPDDCWQKGQPIRHEFASTLAVMELLKITDPSHESLATYSAGEIDEQVASPKNALGSALANLQPEDIDLLLFLVASHHGKVRLTMTSTASDQDDGDSLTIPICGVHDGDQLPSVELCGIGGSESISMPEVNLHLDLAEMGLSARYGRSWQERVASLFEGGSGIGVFELAYLEAVFRASDCRASQRGGADPEFV